MIKLALGLALALATSASAAPAATEMGKWDCNGSKPQQVDVTPGDHDYVWRGSCSGAEGYSIVVEPRDTPLVTTQGEDAKQKGLVLHVTNKTKRTIHMTAYVFVGFA